MTYLTSARLENPGGAWEGAVRNISSDGMFLETTRQLTAGERLQIGFRLRHSRQRVEMAAEIKRVTPDGVGIEIDWE
jgi:hypothetical protein